MTRTLIMFNGRFATRPASGVERVAGELVRAFRALADESGAEAPVLSLALPGAPGIDPAGALRESDAQSLLIRRGSLRGHVWEQTELQFLERRAWLFSPCNVGPILRRRQLAVIHDAQSFVAPDAYSWAFRILYRALLPRLARRADIVVTVSEYSKTQLEQFGVVPAGKAHVVHNGADHILRIPEDPATLARHGLSPRGYILAIGSLAPHKNLAMLVEAAGARPADSPELVIAGGDQPHIFADAGITPRPGCRLLGRVTDTELRALYENALALAFPSRTEGFGLPPLEAMNCGCPVVASTAGAIKEVCGSSALYLDPNDPTAWRGALERIASDAPLRQRLIARGRASAAELTWRAAARRYLALISSHDASGYERERANEHRNGRKGISKNNISRRVDDARANR